jgi:hypothetical protein
MGEKKKSGEKKIEIGYMAKEKITFDVLIIQEREEDREERGGRRKKCRRKGRETGGRGERELNWSHDNGKK